ncbi:site-2 protease family protein [Cohnella cholangitidis]|uniref:Site-2 protease family protein n=1 Tax=Cohnella cholangitidis TaxID=2598458 RepID=A0A7G5C0L8_9BACL|nr:site-2 protease family protein [Cohnella cholangitidis]QMV42752.1 site-2 protease family protein [Cohnella cholangitidis]
MNKSKSRSLLAGIGVFLLAKFKWAIALLKWTKFGGTFISMMVSLGAYAAIYGWKFGVALVYLIFVHEMGHLIAAKRKGIPMSPAFFIPFVGAMVSMKERPRDAATEAYLAYGGPLAGLISFLPAVVLYETTGEPFWALVVFLGAFLNLFNLIPISPLDGGRIVSVLSTKIWFVGLLALGVVVAISPSPFLFFIILIGLFSWWSRAKENYQGSVMAYEREKLAEYRSAILQWPNLSSTWTIKQTLSSQADAAKQKEAGMPKRLIPFLHDEERLARDQAKMDQRYASMALSLIQEWEHQPVQYEEADPSRPIPSRLLEDAIEKADERIKLLDVEIRHFRTYYKAPASVKWKVLAAYLLLAGVLSAFMWYGHRIMELYR